MADSWQQIDDDGVLMDWTSADTLKLCDLWHPIEAIRRALLERQNAANFYYGEDHFNFDILSEQIELLSDPYDIANELKQAAQGMLGEYPFPVYGSHDNLSAYPNWEMKYYPTELDFTFSPIDEISSMVYQLYVASNRLRCLHLRYGDGGANMIPSDFSLNAQYNLYKGAGWIDGGANPLGSPGALHSIYGSERKRVKPSFTLYNSVSYKVLFYGRVIAAGGSGFNNQGDTDFYGNPLSNSLSSFVLLWEENGNSSFFSFDKYIPQSTTEPALHGGWNASLTSGGAPAHVIYQQPNFNFRDW